MKIESRDGWRAFIEEYTPTLIAIIRHAGVREHDEVMDIYVRVCEHLSDNDCARLRRHDASKGRLAAWLTIVVRRVMVDWIRSEHGRKRLFQSIRALRPIDQRVFELYYWRGHAPSAIVELLRSGQDAGALTLGDVFESLERVEQALSERQRAELVSMAAGVREPAQLEDEYGQPRVEPADEGLEPWQAIRARETSEALTAALAELPAEDALIVSMRYLDGLSHAQVARALHIAPAGAGRMREILQSLREILQRRGIEA
jgi:RNA polymerase sigma factor (sigma-70 family)